MDNSTEESGGYSLWGHKQLDTTEQPTLSLFLMSCRLSLNPLTSLFFKLVLIILIPLAFPHNFRITLLIKNFLGFWLGLYWIYRPILENWYHCNTPFFFLVALSGAQNGQEGQWTWQPLASCVCSGARSPRAQIWLQHLGNGCPAPGSWGQDQGAAAPQCRGWGRTGKV